MHPGSRWAALGMAAPLILVLLVCLILTKSRSAYLGLFVGMSVLAWRARRHVSPRVLLAMGLAGLCVRRGSGDRRTGHGTARSPGTDPVADVARAIAGNTGKGPGA